MEHVLLVGLSTRAAAASAAHAGFRVTALDAFADMDQHPGVHALATVAGRFTATAATRLAATLRDSAVSGSAVSGSAVSGSAVSGSAVSGSAVSGSAVEGSAVAYLSPFENHPRAVQRLAANRLLLGNSPDVLRRVRDPIVVADTFARHGFAVPRAVRHPAAATAGARWMLKPLASGGGTRIREWLPAEALAKAGHGRGWSRRYYLQERIEGVAGSIAFVAAGGRTVPLGVSRQLTGEAAFGADGFRYCGSIRLAPGDAFSERTRSIARQLADCAAASFGLVGLNGIDFIVRDEVPLPIEINPRWCASMELAERFECGAVFAAHARACREGTLPGPDAFAVANAAPAWGKAIVFATATVTAGDTRPWLTDDWRRDIPHPGESIVAGQPICTVFAAGADADDCRRALVARAAEVYEALR